MQERHRRPDGDPCLSKQPQRAEADGAGRGQRSACPTRCCIRSCAPIPENGRKSIYINPIRIEGIVGMDHKEALPLLDELLAHATQPQFQYRHRWQPGDLVIWDNRCLLHKANGDYDMGQMRYLYRVMLQGDVPA